MRTRGAKPPQIDKTMVAEKVDFDKELQEIERQTNESVDYVQSLGLKLPDIVLDMRDWLTIKRYAEKYGVSTNVVSNWISRGTIPADCVQVVPELNDIKLIRDQPYR